MDYIAFDAIKFSADGRVPHVVSLQTSSMPGSSPRGGPSEIRLPHPEVHMEYIQESFGARAWKYQIVRELDGMTRSFAFPYIIFYPAVSRDGRPFPLNKGIRDIQGRNYGGPDMAWRGNIIVAKYEERPGVSPFATLADTTMADFAILKNWFYTHGSP